MIDYLKEEMINVCLNISRHPRNQEVVDYIPSEYEKKIPGITEYIANNFDVYGKIMNHEYESAEINDALIADTIKEECSLENVRKENSNKLKRN